MYALLGPNFDKQPFLPYILVNIRMQTDHEDKISVEW